MMKVSILCLTYNHRKYIRQTLDGFIMQKTNFDFEVLINDDASSDGTVEIIKEYAEKYPDTIKPNFQKENLYSQGVRGITTKFLLPKARGEYIALCEGDDYWTEQNKLQLQVDFLEKNPKYALCFHPVKVFFEKHEDRDSISPANFKPEDATVKNLLKWNFIETSSVLYRRQNYNHILSDLIPGDRYLHLYHAQYGKIGFIDKVMSVYRRHEAGIWWDSYDDRDEIWRKHGIKYLEFYEKMLDMYGDNSEHREVIFDSVNRILKDMVRIARDDSSIQISDVLKSYPIFGESFVKSQYDILMEKESRLVDYKEAVDKRNRAIDKKNYELNLKKKEIEYIKSSRFWKIRNFAAKIIGKPVV